MSALINLFYLYDPWLFHVVRMSLLIGFLSLLWLGYKWYKKEIKQIFIPLDSLWVCAVLIGISVIPILINGTSEFGVIGMYVKSLVVFIFGIVIYNVFYCHSEGKQQFIRDVNIGIGVQSGLGALALAGIPLFIAVALGTNSDMGGQLPRFIGSEQEYRLYNFTSSAFFPLSAFYLMLLHFLLAYGEKKSTIQYGLCISHSSYRADFRQNFFYFLSGQSGGVFQIALYPRYRRVCRAGFVFCLSVSYASLCGACFGAADQFDSRRNQHQFVHGYVNG